MSDNVNYQRTRRYLLGLTATMACSSIAGCFDTDDEMEPQETIRLGTAASITLSYESDQSFSSMEQALTRAGSHLARHVAEILDDHQTGSGVWVNIEDISVAEISGEVAVDDFDRPSDVATVVTHRSVFEDGEVVVEPAISFEELRALVPHSATVVLDSPGDSFEFTLPVVVHRYTTE